MSIDKKRYDDVVHCARELVATYNSLPPTKWYSRWWGTDGGGGLLQERICALESVLGLLDEPDSIPESGGQVDVYTPTTYSCSVGLDEFGNRCVPGSSSYSGPPGNWSDRFIYVEDFSDFKHAFGASKHVGDSFSDNPPRQHTTDFHDDPDALPDCLHCGSENILVSRPSSSHLLCIKCFAEGPAKATTKDAIAAYGRSTSQNDVMAKKLLECEAERDEIAARAARAKVVINGLHGRFDWDLDE